MSEVTDQYNIAKQTNPNLTLGEFRASYETAAPPPSTSPTNATPTNPQVSFDSNALKQKASGLGFSEIQQMQMQDNPLYQKRLMEATYGDKAAMMPEYQKLTQAEDQRAGLREDLGTFRGDTGNLLMAVEEGLRAKGDIGKVQSESEIFNKAGLTGYENIYQSLQAGTDAMKSNYNSFLNQIQQVQGLRSNQYANMADQYKLLTDDYDKQVTQLDNTLNQIQQFNDGIALAKIKLQNDKDLALWQSNLEGGRIDPDTGETVEPVPASESRDRSSGASDGAGRINPSSFISFQSGDNVDGFSKSTDYGVFLDENGQPIARITSTYGADHSDISGEKSHNGLDVVFGGVRGAPDYGKVRALQGGRVIKAGIDNAYGGFVVIEDENGDRLQYGHVDAETARKMQKSISENKFLEVKAGEHFINHETDKNKWGSSSAPHTDIRYVGTKEVDTGAPTAGGLDLSKYDPDAVEKARSIMDPLSIASYNDLTATEKGKVEPILTELKRIALGEGDIYGVMAASAGGKDATTDFQKSFEKGQTVINSIGALTDLLNKDEAKNVDTGEEMDLSPISGWLAEKNPWDTDAQTMQAILTATVPNLARGVYGEVGVLTDRDVALYMQTLPNLRQTNDVKKAITALTLRQIRTSLDNKIKIQAATGVDMSGMKEIYKDIDEKVKTMEDELGIGKTTEEEVVEEVETDLTSSSTDDEIRQYLIENNRKGTVEEINFIRNQLA